MGNGKGQSKNDIKTSQKKSSGGKFDQAKFNNKKSNNKSGAKSKKSSKSDKKTGKKESTKKTAKTSNGKKSTQKKDNKKAGAGQKKEQKKTSSNTKKNTKSSNKANKSGSAYLLTGVLVIVGMLILAVLAYLVWSEPKPQLPNELYSLWGARQYRRL